jgi:hypothetical protein
MSIIVRERFIWSYGKPLLEMLHVDWLKLLKLMFRHRDSVFSRVTQIEGLEMKFETFSLVMRFFFHAYARQTPLQYFFSH